MTSTTKEILEKFQIRKTGKQKESFRQWLIPLVQQYGYDVKVEKGSFSRNIVIGDVDTADVIFAAHYDTCAVMPFPNFITPTSSPIYLVYQFVLTFFMFAVAIAASVVARFLIPEYSYLVSLVVLYAMLALLIFGPANKNTANDNTSGVTAVLDLIQAMPEELKGKAAFVLFDLEEAGLIGSAAFASKHKKVMKEKLLVNLDCVSDGETMLFCFRKKSKADVELFRSCFPSDQRIQSDFVTKGYVYPSDQANFPRGVGVAALKKTKRGLLYMDRIHTPKDTVYREENIAYLVEGCIRLTEQL